MLCALVTSAAHAQAASEQQNISPTAADESAAAEATIKYMHARPANTEAGASLRARQIVDATLHRSSASTPAEIETNDKPRFPADLNYLGGAVVQTAESHPIFMLPNGKCPIATCWGNPEQFLRDYAIGELAHITDQYVHDSAGNRYTLGKDVRMSYKPPAKPLTDADVQKFVHSAATKLGDGLGHIYHVFLPPGQAVCFTSADISCYSSDNPAFCAYHSSVKFKDLSNEVLYTVEPFQNVPGCSVRPGTPNGTLIDSTNNSLSHELTETITDPNGDAWINFTAVILAGAEIGDECSFFTVIPQGNNLATPFDPTVFTMGNHIYAVQPEYNNEDHSCTVEP